MIKKILTILWMTFTILQISYGQNSDTPIPVTDTYYFKNATVYKSPQTKIENASVLVKNGLIEKVGKNLSIPYDAQVIDMDSLIMYPAFIDAASHTGYKDPEIEIEKARDPGNPSYLQAGHTPQLGMRSVFAQSDAMKGQRNMGFGYAHVLPKGRMLPGKGSVVMTSESDFSDKVLNEDMSLFAQFRPAKRVYPNTILGVMTRYRELFKNAKSYKISTDQYKLNPLGINKPKADEVLNALSPAAHGKQKIFFYTPKIKDIFRAIKLQKELGLDVVLVGLENSADILDNLKKSSNDIVLSLKLPEKLKEIKKEDATDEEWKLYQAKKKAYDRHLHQTKTFLNSGIKISYASLNVKEGDVLKNLRRIYESGVSESDLLACLTTNPSKLLGIDKMTGTLEPGKIANFFVTDKPYFEEKSKVKFVFNNGKLHELKSKSAGGKGDLKSATGTWKYEIIIPDRTEEGKIFISKENEEYIVEVSSDQAAGKKKASSVEIDGNNVSFQLQVDREGMSLDLKYTITIDKESMTGNVDTGVFGSFPLEGSKIEDPE